MVPLNEKVCIDDDSKLVQTGPTDMLRPELPNCDEVSLAVWDVGEHVKMYCRCTPNESATTLLVLEPHVSPQPDRSVACIGTEESAWLGGTGDGPKARAVVAQLSATWNRTESCREA